jgi:hypothetical protein
MAGDLGGVAFVIRQPLLRAVMIAGSMLMLFETAWTSIQAVFLVRDLRLPATMYGLLVAVGAAGELVGALFRNRTVASTDTPAPTMAG